MDTRKQMELIPPAVEDAVSGGEEPDGVGESVRYGAGRDGDAACDDGGCEYVDLGVGGMLRPMGARRQDLNVRVGELAAALNAVPEG